MMHMAYKFHSTLLWDQMQNSRYSIYMFSFKAYALELWIFYKYLVLLSFQRNAIVDDYKSWTWKKFSREENFANFANFGQIRENKFLFWPPKMSIGEN